MDGLIAAISMALDMLVGVVLQVLVALGNIVESFSNTEAGKQLGLNTNNYPGAPTEAHTVTVQTLQEFGVDKALKFLIPVILIYVFLPKLNLSKKAK